MFRELKLVRGMRADVGEELRGWRWGEPPVAPPPLGVRLSVSEIVGGYCESRRDLYLRRVLRVRAEPNGSMKFGAYIHEVFRRSLIGLRRLVEEGAASGWELIRRFDGEALAREAAEAVGAEPDPRGVARFLAVQVAARVDEVASRSGADPLSVAARAVPLLAEYVVDGRPLGLTLVRADAVVHGAVLEVKVGERSDRHALALAGYALAIEADEEVPVDAGLLVYVQRRRQAEGRAGGRGPQEGVPGGEEPPHGARALRRGPRRLPELRREVPPLRPLPWRSWLRTTACSSATAGGPWS